MFGPSTLTSSMLASGKMQCWKASWLSSSRFSPKLTTFWAIVSSALLSTISNLEHVRQCVRTLPIRLTVPFHDEEFALTRSADLGHCRGIGHVLGFSDPVAP